MLSETRDESEGAGGGLKAKLAARFKKRTEDSPEKKRQLEDYTAWVNNYLRRRPGTPVVSDLRWSLGDGVTFIHLVEILARAQVAGVVRWPTSSEGKRANTERALEFLRGHGVALPQEACRDLMEGNVKGVMKVILAVAERYQPKSVKPRGAPEPAKPANHIAPDTNLPRQELIRPYTHPQTNARLEYGHSLSQPAPPIHHACHQMAPPTYPVAPLEEVYSSPIDQLPAHKPPQVISGKKKAAAVAVRVAALGMQGIPEEAALDREGAEEKAELVGEIGAVVTGLAKFKRELLQLHSILLRNNDGVRDVGGATVEGVRGRGESGQERTAQDREREVAGEMASLRQELQHMRDECTQAEVECTTLRSMVEERNAFITTMKSEIYRKEYLNDTERAELHTQLLHKDTQIKKLEMDLVSCHGNLETTETELGTLRGDLEQRREAVERNRVELEQLREELQRVSASEERLSLRLSAKEKKLVASEERLTEERERVARRTQQMNEDVEALTEGLAKLAAESAHTDQLQALQKTLVDMATKLSLDKLLPSSPARRRRHRDKEQEDHPRHRRKHRDRHTSAQEPHPPATPTVPNITRVLYYMEGDKTDAPFVAMVPKKASEVTLKDFKMVFGRHGDHRFFFKTEDPDCGVVKEEVVGDDQTLPNMKGKVTAWIRDAGSPFP